MKRCEWCEINDVQRRYHDIEWGVPIHDDRRLFEALSLSGAQAGLNWDIILRRRPGYRKAFDGFDYNKIAKYDSRKISLLLKDPGIIRNRLKIASVINNAKALIALRKEFGSFDKYLWTSIGNKQIINHPLTSKHIAATSMQSDAISKDLKKRGFSFVGTTIIYAFMQAVGMVDDHVKDCWRKKPGR